MRQDFIVLMGIAIAAGSGQSQSTSGGVGASRQEFAKPELLPRDVVSAANYASGAVIPGQVVILYPANAGPSNLAESHLDGAGKMASSTGGTRILFDDIAAPVVYASRGQVGVVVPYALSDKKNTSIVVEYQGQRSDPLILPVAPAAPALYTLDSSGKGQAAMLNETGCCNSSRNPATQGSVAQIFATGAGQTTPRGIDGLYSDYSRLADYPKPQLPVSVMVGGIPAEILYAGEASLHVSGTFVVNFRIPANAPVGNAVPLVLRIGDYQSPDDVTMAIRSSAQRVLVVDRDPVTRQALNKMLSDSGYEVAIAQDGQQAASLAKEHPPDLMICDLNGNAAAIRNIKGEHQRLKLIVILEAATSENLRGADLAGAQAVFARPLAADRLLQRSRDLLAARAFP